MTIPISVRNPRTGSIDYWIDPVTLEQLTAECNHLRQGQLDWQNQGVEYRIKVLQAWKQALITHKQDLIQALSTDTGRVSESAIEVDSLLSNS